MAITYVRSQNDSQLRRIAKQVYCVNPIRLCAWNGNGRDMGTGKKVEYEAGDNRVPLAGERRAAPSLSD